MHLILFFQTGLFIFEMLSLLYIKRKRKINKLTAPISGRYLKALIEAMSLHSPVAYSYFLFIIPSTLRLNFKIEARIEQLNRNYYSKILVSEDVMDHLNHVPLYHPEFLGKVDLKGWVSHGYL